MLWGTEPLGNTGKTQISAIIPSTLNLAGGEYREKREDRIFVNCACLHDALFFMREPESVGIKYEYGIRAEGRIQVA